MLRSILWGSFSAGIILVALAEATATSDQSVVSPIPTPVALDRNHFTKSPAFLPESNADSPKVSRIPKIDNQLWLQDLASIFLTGSMFPGCQRHFKGQQDHWGVRDSSSGDSFAVLECLFAWQQPVNLDRKPKSSSIPSLSALDNDIASLQPDIRDRSTKTPPAQHQFPKLSRSSLIVSFPATDSDFVPLDTKFANPAPATKRIASPFGWRKRPYSYQLQFHQGIDYGAPFGSPVVAVGDGIVTRVVSGCYDFGNLFCGGQLGNWIEIDHGNGAVGVYGHLKNNSITVKEGMKVWKNQEIAQVGSSGWSTGAHLDFRFKLDGEYQDPAQYLAPPDAL